MTNEEFYEALKQQNKIVDYARELGFTVVRKGKYYSLKEHDSVIINPDKNCYWRNSMPGSGRSIGKGGSIIDFLVEFEGVTIKEAIKILKDRTSIRSMYVRKKTTEKKDVQQVPLILPERADNMRMVFAYLTKTRCIAQNVVQEFVDRKMLYQDTNNNCVFVGYDETDKEKVVFACRRGTNTYKPFYGDVAGCDYTKCMYIDNGSAEIIITESVIDAMSIMTLMGETYNQYNYLILAGVGKWDCIRNCINDNVKKVYIATDNDKGGIASAQLICNYIKLNYPGITRKWKLPPGDGKDWNLMLQERRINEQ